MTTELMSKGDTIVTAFERLDESAPVHAIRRAALERFHALGWPSTRDESWLYTNVKPITKIVTESASAPADRAVSVTPEQIHEPTLWDAGCHRLVFVNGRYEAALSTSEDPGAGIRIADLRSVIADDYGSIEPYLARYASYDDEAFTALNTAFLEDGAVIVLPPKTQLQKPLHVVFVTAGTETAPITAHPRVLLVAGEASGATVVESYVGLGGGVAFTNAVTEIVAAKRASIDHYRIQRDNDESFHVSTLTVHQAGSNEVTSHCYTNGGRLVRNNINAILDGEECDATFNGLYMNRGRQLVDNNLRIDHMKPHCRSWQFYKGILEDRSTGAFAGRIFVEKDAQKTDAKQTNMSLLLSDDAHAYTKPQLEIFADDVKCTHGATVGQLEESQMFYLQARGVSRDAARSLLIYAFANATIGEVKIDALRGKLEHELMDRLPSGHLLKSGL